MEEIDFKEFVQFFWSKKIVIVLITLICAILGGIYTMFFVTPLYSATTSLILVKMDFEDEADVAAYSKLIDRYTVVASSRTIIEKVIENLKLDTTVKELRKNIAVSSNASTYNIKIAVTDSNSAEAAKIANEAAKVFMDEIVNIYNDSKIKVLEYAIEDTKPINVNLFENIIMFSVVGIVIACGYFLCIFMFKNSIYEKENKKTHSDTNEIKD